MMKIDRELFLVIKSSGLGEGEPDLGEKLMRGFLTKLFESGKIPAKIAFMNSGIFLTTEGSSFIDILQNFADEGCEILSCGTCLHYYNRQDKLIIGNSSNMEETVDAMLQFAKVLIP